MYFHSYMEQIWTMDSNVSKILVLNCGFHEKTERRLFCFFFILRRLYFYEYRKMFILPIISSATLNNVLIDTHDFHPTFCLILLGFNIYLSKHEATDVRSLKEGRGVAWF